MSAKVSRREARQRALVADTLARWRAGNRALGELGSADDRRAYEHAIELARRHLPRPASMAEMVWQYWQVSGAVEDCIRCASLCGDPRGGLDAGVVRDVAFWRRLRLLVRERS
jgi:hypothetical protein